MWQYKILEVTTPNLNTLRIAFMLQRDGVDYVGDEVVFMSNELTGTANEKKAAINLKIRAKCFEYVAMYNYKVALESLIGTVIEV